MLHQALYWHEDVNGKVAQYTGTEGRIRFTEVKTGSYSGTFEMDTYDPVQKKIVRMYDGYFNGLIRK